MHSCSKQQPSHTTVPSSVLLYVHRDRIRDGEPWTATSTFTHLLSFEGSLFVQCCSTSTETVGTIRDGEPRTATELRSCVKVEVDVRGSRP